MKRAFTLAAIAINGMIKENGLSPTIFQLVYRLADKWEDRNGFDRDEFKDACGLTEYRWVKNLMSQQMVLERKNTPYFCSVASETYWSR